MKTAIAILAIIATCGCVKLDYDGHKEHRVWYWSDEAVAHRQLEASVKSAQKTNEVFIKALNDGNKGTNNVTPGK
jgi:hypothetical protein